MDISVSWFNYYITLSLIQTEPLTLTELCVQLNAKLLTLLFNVFSILFTSFTDLHWINIRDVIGYHLNSSPDYRLIKIILVIKGIKLPHR